MWLLPLFLVGLVVYAHNSARAAIIPPKSLQPPGPIAVLGECVRIGRSPPPRVILCAIAEAEALGRNDLAHDIMAIFVLPVVEQHVIAKAKPAVHRPLSQVVDIPATPQAALTDRKSSSTFTTDEQIRSILNSDPERFMEMAINPQRAQVATIEEPPPYDTITTYDQPHEEPIDSPIPEVPSATWSVFCTRLARETPIYQSSRHIGQYRQRKERLAELGIDPKSVLGSVNAQQVALNADVADACHHVQQSGVADEHVNRLIALPGHEDPHTVTLSGVLGVVQAAGLEGAVSWLENQNDRKRFPHTTAAFLRTNGVF